MQLLIATTNKHKVREIAQILAPYGVYLKQKKLKLAEPDFESLEQIAEAKARQAFAKLERPVIAEDTGVYFEAYNNFPGTLAKRVFLGIGFGGLLLLIKHAKNRRAHFRTVICFFDGRAMKTFSGKLEGRLLAKTVSLEKDRLPYEKIFVPRGSKKALVDLSVGEKNRISHRAKAAGKLARWLSAR